jgi:hypothetical protein
MFFFAQAVKGIFKKSSGTLVNRAEPIAVRGRYRFFPVAQIKLAVE